MSLREVGRLRQRTRVRTPAVEDSEMSRAAPKAAAMQTGLEIVKELVGACGLEYIECLREARPQIAATECHHMRL